RTTPVEAVDQRGADRLHERLEGDRVAGERTGRIGEFAEVAVAEVGSAVFGLHEPARRGDAEDVQVVLDAATDEHAAVGGEAVGVQARRRAAQRGQSRARPVRTGPAAVDVGENVRGNQVTEAGADGVGVTELLGAGERGERVGDVAAQ